MLLSVQEVNTILSTTIIASIKDHHDDHSSIAASTIIWSASMFFSSDYNQHYQSPKVIATYCNIK